MLINNISLQKVQYDCNNCVSRVLADIRLPKNQYEFCTMINMGKCSKLELMNEFKYQDTVEMESFFKNGLSTDELYSFCRDTIANYYLGQIPELKAQLGETEYYTGHFGSFVNVFNNENIYSDDE